MTIVYIFLISIHDVIGFQQLKISTRSTQHYQFYEKKGLELYSILFSMLTSNKCMREILQKKIIFIGSLALLP